MSDNNPAEYLRGLALTCNTLAGMVDGKTIDGETAALINDVDSALSALTTNLDDEL